jgi:hypothetical protein
MHSIYIPRIQITCSFASQMRRRRLARLAALDTAPGAILSDRTPSPGAHSPSPVEFPAPKPVAKVDDDKMDVDEEHLPSRATSIDSDKSQGLHFEVDSGFENMEVEDTENRFSRKRVQYLNFVAKKLLLGKFFFADNQLLVRQTGL